jgi:prostamide/prostaglandin F2alpha synthase
VYSRRLSALKPQLDANNVRMVGVGLEELGVEEFVEGKFFDGGKWMQGSHLV